MQVFQKLLVVIFSIGFFFCVCDTAIAKKKHKHARSHHHGHHARRSGNSDAVVASSIVGADNLSDTLNRILRYSDPNVSFGLEVKSMQTGDVLYSRNANHFFVPASTLKVLTAEAALLYLGPQFKFATSILMDSKSSISDGVLNGDLYLVHSGDPSLTYPDFFELMEALRSQQIHEVNGNIYIDSTAYDQATYAPGWMWKDTQYCYAAPISASIINHNCMTFKMVPGAATGYPANVVADPNHFYASIQNSVTTKPSWTRSCYIHLGMTSENTIALSGCLPKKRVSQGVSAVVPNIMEYNRELIRSLFNQYGIQIHGNILPGAAPSGLPVVATHLSKPLQDLIHEMLKKSDNIIAGSLFKKMGELYFNEQGSWINGSKAVTSILSQKANVDTSRINVIDGSGLSRYNQVSPAQMMQVLDFAYHHEAISYEFISALPIAGVDGTLKKRLRNIAGKVRAKTGTISGVVALAGYAMTKNKEPLAFVIMVNGRNGMGWRYKEIEDKVVTALVRYSHG